MKKTISCLLLLLLSACATPAATGTPVNTVALTGTPAHTTVKPTVPCPTAAATTVAVTAQPTVTPLPTPSATQNPELQALYAQSANLLVAVDAFGRTVAPVLGDKQNREVGIFYWLWHGFHQQEGIFDNTKLLAEYGIQKVLTTSFPESPAGASHYWGEPLYGYYNSRDEYVLRKHMELLAYAGVDYIVFDATNTLIYNAVTRKLFAIIKELRAEGVDAPQVAYFTHTRSLDTVRQLYRDVYSKPEYQDVFYRYSDGKPLLIAYQTPAADIARQQLQNPSTSYNPAPLSNEILEYFHFRTPSWVGTDPAGTPADGWPWCEWVYPQPVYTNVMSVTVASHHGYPFSHWYKWGITNWGRGYSFTDNKNSEQRALQGTFFQDQWDTAFEKQPEYVFVGGWNEWFIGKSGSEGDYYFWDNFTMQYSRDIEMMKGGYNDAFLIQLAKNTRAYTKNNPPAGIKNPYTKIDITGNPAQWEGVQAVYRHIGQKSYGRNFAGANPSLRYETPAPVNAVQSVTVAMDKERVFFRIQCEKNVSAPGAQNWLNLFIGTGTPSRKGWEGYEFVLNRSVAGGKTRVESLAAGFTAKTIGQGDIQISGSVVQISVPRSLLGLSATSQFYFKVADSVQNPSDIMDYYVTGRSTPMGRFSYQYLGTG